MTKALTEQQLEDEEQRLRLAKLGALKRWKEADREVQVAQLKRQEASEALAHVTKRWEIAWEAWKAAKGLGNNSEDATT